MVKSFNQVRSLLLRSFFCPQKSTILTDTWGKKTTDKRNSMLSGIGAYYTTTDYCEATLAFVFRYGSE